MPKVRNNYFGYSVRTPYKSEMEYFKKNPHVGGMAAEDGRIILNPHSGLNMKQLRQVAINEAARLWMRDNKYVPKFGVSNKQRSFFSGSPYEGNDDAIRQTILGRILSGDSSAGDVTDQQRLESDYIRKMMIRDAWRKKKNL